MSTAFQHRPMSQILAQAPEVASESGQAPAPAAPEAPAVPDKYKDKTIDQVIEMHQNAESAYGRSQNELTQARGLITDLSAISRTPAPPEVPELEEVNVSGDDLLANPGEAIRSVLQPELDRLEAESFRDKADTQIVTESNALMRDYPNMNQIVASEEFQLFSARTAGRQADFNVAAQGEGLDQVRAARRLLEDYSDFEALVTPNPDAAPTPVQQARQASTEGGRTGAPISTKPQLFESDVIALINSDPTKYRSPSYQTELIAAMKEGRFVKNS